MILSAKNREGFRYFSKVPLLKNEDLDNACIFPWFDKQEVDDAFTGTYRDTDIVVSEQEMTLLSRYKERVMFAGVCVFLRLNKKFNGQTTMKQKGGWLTILKHNLLTLLILFGPAFIAFGVWCRGTRVSLEDIVFVYGVIGFVFFIYFGIPYLCHLSDAQRPKRNKMRNAAFENKPFLRSWRIMSSNEREIEAILTPSFVEKLENLKKLYCGNLVDVSFYDDKVMICVHTTKDLFIVPSLFVPSLKFSETMKIFQQVSSILDVIDELRLNM